MDTDPTIAEIEAEPGSARTSTLRSARGGRIELINRGEPRRRWPVEQKQAIAAASLAPGASPTAVARRYGISTGLLYTWRKALLAAQPRLSGFARVEIAGPANQAMSRPALLTGPPVQAAGTVEIVLPNSTTIRVDAQIDPRALRRILAALRG
ncbi:MAG TPA: transposase [Pseudoxanthomonas sp.]